MSPLLEHFCLTQRIWTPLFYLPLCEFVQSEHWKKENINFRLPFFTSGTSTFNVVNVECKVQKDWGRWRDFESNQTLICVSCYRYFLVYCNLQWVFTGYKYKAIWNPNFEKWSKRSSPLEFSTPFSIQKVKCTSQWSIGALDVTEDN